MSDTIRQDKNENQQSNSNLSQTDGDLQKPESNTSTPNSLLSDADYEFLFNQLLEGIAHGWHDRRITKFFVRLSDRAKQEDWIAWLERIKPRLMKLPIQSKHQLGIVLTRLGELTKSTTEANRIGVVSYSLGRELLLNDTTTVIWEYVGPDLGSKPATPKIEVAPEENQTTAENIENLTNTAQTSARNIGFVGDSAKAITEPNDFQDSLDSTNLDEITDRYSQEFEFESSQSQPRSENLSILSEYSIDNGLLSSEADREHPPTKADLPLAASEEELALIARGIEPLARETSPTETIELWDDEPAAIDPQQVMQLIQQDPELAQQILQKLKISLTPRSQNRATVSESFNKSNQELIESWFNLGLKQVSAGEFQQAIASWEKALNIDPNLSEAWHNRGSALGRLGNYQAAIDSFENALAIDPHNYQAWNDRAHALYQLEQWIEAVNSWNNALKIVPGNHLFWYNRGCALEQLEQWSEAIASYERSLEIKPDFQLGRTRYINLVTDNSRSN